MPHLAGCRHATTAVAFAVLGKPEPWRRLLSEILASSRQAYAENSTPYSPESIPKGDVHVMRSKLTKIGPLIFL